MGEWGWVLAQKQSPGTNLKQALQNLEFSNTQTRWLNNDAIKLITSFGKDTYIWKKDTVKVNKIHDPVLYKYYIKGNWDLY